MRLIYSLDAFKDSSDAFKNSSDAFKSSSDAFKSLSDAFDLEVNFHIYAHLNWSTTLSDIITVERHSEGAVMRVGEIASPQVNIEDSEISIGMSTQQYIRFL